MWNECEKWKKDGLEGPRQLLKKGLTPPQQLFFFFDSVMPYSKNDLEQKQLEEDLALFIVKELVPLSFVEAPFFRRLILRQHPCFNFPSSWVLINEVLLKITKKMKEKYIFSTLESCNTCMVSFDLWMSRLGVDTFVFIVHFLNDKWEPCHVTIGFLR